MNQCTYCGLDGHRASHCPNRPPRTAIRAGIVATLMLLAGCGTLDGKLDNRLACTVAGDKLYALSEYGPISVGSRISDVDRRVVCRAPANSPGFEGIK